MLFSCATEKEKKELWAILALRHCRGIGAVRAKKLVEHYGTAFDAVDEERAKSGAWVRGGIFNRKSYSSFATEEWRKSALNEWSIIQKQNLSFLLITDPSYPYLLREILDAPLLLYCKGDTSLLNNAMISIVGSRVCTQEGIRVCSLLAKGLSDAGITIVSGMAKGIDRYAHTFGLKSVGKSIAVLGTGIDVTYPKSNHDIATLLSSDGLLVTEFPPETKPLNKNFPIRNRIISGLSYGVVIVEAFNKSGSLITARLALEQNREVFVVPGNSMSSFSAGCHGLIRNGAKPVFTVDDILMELAPLLASNIVGSLGLKKKEKINKKIQLDSQQENESKSKKIETNNFAEPELTIINMLSDELIHIDELSRKLGYDIAQLSSLLTMLEIKGAVIRKPGMLYKLP